MSFIAKILGRAKEPPPPDEQTIESNEISEPESYPSVDEMFPDHRTSIPDDNAKPNIDFSKPLYSIPCLFTSPTKFQQMIHNENPQQVPLSPPQQHFNIHVPIFAPTPRSPLLTQETSSVSFNPEQKQETPSPNKGALFSTAPNPAQSAMKQGSTQLNSKQTVKFSENSNSESTAFEPCNDTDLPIGETLPSPLNEEQRHERSTRPSIPHQQTNFFPNARPPIQASQSAKRTTTTQNPFNQLSQLSTADLPADTSHAGTETRFGSNEYI